MSKQVARAYKEFLKNEKKSQAAMSSKSAAGYMGIAAPRNPIREKAMPSTPIQEVQGIVSMIRKRSGADNG